MHEYGEELLRMMMKDYWKAFSTYCTERKGEGDKNVPYRKLSSYARIYNNKVTANAQEKAHSMTI